MDRVEKAAREFDAEMREESLVEWARGLIPSEGDNWHFDPLDPPETPGVYVLRDSATTVKIGKATNIAKRMRELQTGNPLKLRLIAILSDDMEDERKFHDRFKAYRISGEWFRFEQPIRDAVAMARAG